MFIRNLGLSAALALAANAILLPPTVSEDITSSDDRDNALLNSGVDPKHVLVSVNCDHCPFATQEGKQMVWTEDKENSLVGCDVHEEAEPY
jgi:hypothetical protein